MNTNMIINMLKGLFPNQSNKIQEAINKAQEVMNTCNNPQEALSKAGVSGDFLQGLKGSLSNPIASGLLAKMGLDKTSASTILDNLSNQKSTQITQPEDDLSRLKQGLNKLK